MKKTHGRRQPEALDPNAELRKLGLGKCVGCPRKGKLKDLGDPLNAAMFCDIGAGRKEGAGYILLSLARKCTNGACTES